MKPRNWWYDLKLFAKTKLVNKAVPIPDNQLKDVTITIATIERGDGVPYPATQV